MGDAPRSGLRRAARWALARGAGARLTFAALPRLADQRSRLRLLRLGAATVLLPERDRPGAPTAVAVGVRGYGQDVWLRPRSRDLTAFGFVTQLHHLPPDTGREPAHIAVFGANLGLLVLDLATRYPAARLLAVEPDPDNAELARRNLAPLGDRCRVVESPVWHSQTEVVLGWTRDAWGLNLAEKVAPSQRSGNARVMRTVAAGEMLDDFTRGQPVDYLLVNVGPAWYELLRHGHWLGNVRSVRVEIQDHYDEALSILQNLGFTTSLHRLGWGAFALGVRC